MPKGTIKMLSERGYGFIKGEGEEDLFFHRNNLLGVEFASLRVGQEVVFEKGQGRDGRPQAVNVRLADIRVENSDEGGDGGVGSQHPYAIVTKEKKYPLWSNTMSNYYLGENKEYDRNYFNTLKMWFMSKVCPKCGRKLKRNMDKEKEQFEQMKKIYDSTPSWYR